jgi:hypothetical protein
VNTLIWVLQILLALAFLAAGAVKLIRPRAVLATTTNLAYVEDLSDATVKAIGALEVLAAAALLLPAMTGIATGLAPLAATGLVVLMIGAVIVHTRRHEPRGIAINLFLLTLAALVAWARSGPYPLT